VFEFANDMFAGIRRRIGLALQARAVRRERRRLDRLYGPSDAPAVAEPLGLPGQAAALSRIVADHYQRSTVIADAHNAARTKLDAAEYAFASLLKELSGVMSEAPSDWAPMPKASRTVEPAADVVPRAIAA
jgi:hypothetical protein